MLANSGFYVSEFRLIQRQHEYALIVVTGLPLNMVKVQMAKVLS